MSRFLLEQDNFYKLTRTSNTVVTLGALTVNTAVSGSGGIDTGSIAASTFYYVYTVINGSGVLALVASTSSTSPTGFTQYRKVGAFYTDGSSNIFKAYRFGEVSNLTYTAVVTNVGVVTTDTLDWINGNAALSGGSSEIFTFTFSSNVFAVAPNCYINPTNATVGNFPSGAQDSVSTSQVVMRTANVNNTADARPFNLLAHKQGVDAIQPDWSR